MAEAASAAAADDWGRDLPTAEQCSPEAAPHLAVEGFAGPLDFLLEMVRRQRLDLGRLPIVALVEQLVAALEDRAGAVPLERRGEWLVMAAELVRLKAQLLWPASPQEAEAAEAEARRRLGQMEGIAVIRAAAAWLGARPQLGQAVFERGRQHRPAGPGAERVVAFWEATLVILEGRAGERSESDAPAAWRPTPPELWRVPEALARIAALLREAPAEGLTLDACLPALDPAAPDRPLQYRAALASTLVAGLELARDGAARIEQEESFGNIRLNWPTGTRHPGELQ
ncbi:segregation/condensation protein A (plasmid) [Roseomonas sp. OT10]|uniref:segregation and condensation protein A n=1 Tax=Roseomonas cutis TaxID=2897332 RepID=UPI001E600D18|nr:segregation/condensation protein A [Roseomonas sp. OT10]UFN51615.1 segregation/condensation protein A [Roseomonas sp. OT10]